MRLTASKLVLISDRNARGLRSQTPMNQTESKQ
jgi:hypothetical protein